MNMNFKSFEEYTKYMKETFEGYKPTKKPAETVKLTETKKRDTSVSIKTKSAFTDAGIKTDTKQDGKGRITVYIDSKPAVKYRVSKNGIVLFFPKMSRGYAENKKLKLVSHGYFNTEQASIILKTEEELKQHIAGVIEYLQSATK